MHMSGQSQTLYDLFGVFRQIDNDPYDTYQRLANKIFRDSRYHLCFGHIQGSPGAFPASVCQLRVKIVDLGLAEGSLASRPRRMATADYLLRAFHAGVSAHATQNRGVQGSGSFQPLALPPQVLLRNLVSFDPEWVHLCFHVSLPASHDHRILGRQVSEMFSSELTGIVNTLKTWVADGAKLKGHCDVVEDMATLQRRLCRYGLVAFVGDGAILPRQSGVSQAPLEAGAVAFRAPDRLAVEVELPNAGPTRGLGIRPGVNVLVGGGFHGKSTLLDALVKGVYPHVPGDGRQQVVTHPEAAFICAENGRAVNGVDISGFIDKLPGGVDTTQFWTANASGSTSEAAAIVESVLAGAKLLLIDEDSSATNFLIKDRHMRKLIPKDAITPLCDRVQELHRHHGVSTLIVAGSSSEYLGVADHVIAMEDYLPVCMTDQARRLSLPAPQQVARPLKFADRRRLLADNFNPSYRVERLDKTLPVRIKPLRLQERVLEYGHEQLDLTRLRALVDPHQVVAIGYALLLARKTFSDRSLSPSELARALSRMMADRGLSILLPDSDSVLFMACPRRLEVAAAVNRLRSLKVEVHNTAAAGDRPSPPPKRDH
jgi:predicted ABC-class ATPase